VQQAQASRLADGAKEGSGAIDDALRKQAGGARGVVMPLARGNARTSHDHLNEY
jgi:hypothetical protein